MTPEQSELIADLRQIIATTERYESHNIHVINSAIVAIRELADAQTREEWVSMTDRPPPNGRYLVIATDYLNDEQIHMICDYDNRWAPCLGEWAYYSEDNRITHWRELPKLPTVTEPTQ